MSTAAIEPGSYGRPVPTRRVVAWGLWDWGSAAYNAVILTFVFSVYLTDAVGDDLPGSISANTWLGWSLGIAGFLVATWRRSPASGPTPAAGASGRWACGPCSP